VSSTFLANLKKAKSAFYFLTPVKLYLHTKVAVLPATIKAPAFPFN